MPKLKVEFYKGRVSACNDLLEEIADMIENAGLLYDERIIKEVQRRLSEYRDIEQSLLDRWIERTKHEPDNGTTGR